MKKLIVGLMLVVGCAGADGQDGVNGMDGRTGPAGLQGERGLQGASGPQGPQGVQAVSFDTLSILCNADNTAAGGHEFWESYVLLLPDGSATGICQWETFEDTRTGYFIGTQCTLVVPGDRGLTTFNTLTKTMTDGLGGPYTLKCVTQ